MRCVAGGRRGPGSAALGGPDRHLSVRPTPHGRDRFGPPCSPPVAPALLTPRAPRRPLVNEFLDQGLRVTLQNRRALGSVERDGLLGKLYRLVERPLAMPDLSKIHEGVAVKE